MMRKVIVFFNGEEPYSFTVGLHLREIRLQYPDGAVKDLPILVVQVPNNARREEYYIASDRDLDDQEVIEAISILR
ncbi:hypothetical protein [Klebsiella oxytoca]|uniref:hypothetical protein n=1 Tax=Klebsiella oxytoca TaxID=571 RepID=UPI00190E920C|nr:hypothetical protein [Klebsiella oxytoca]